MEESDHRFDAEEDFFDQKRPDCVLWSYMTTLIGHEQATDGFIYCPWVSLVPLNQFNSIFMVVEKSSAGVTTTIRWPSEDTSYRLVCS